MDKLSYSSRTCKTSKPLWLLLLALSAFVSLSISKGAAEDNVLHPFIERKDIKSETCLTCHQEKSALPSLIVAVRAGKDVCDT